MKKSDNIVLNKILKYCNDVEFLMQQYHNDFKLFQENISFQYSCSMCIIQIGELVTRLSEDIIIENSQIPWRAIKGMRNLHTHDYENVDLEMVWHTLTKDIPELRKQIEKILTEQITTIVSKFT